MSNPTSALSFQQYATYFSVFAFTLWSLLTLNPLLSKEVMQSVSVDVAALVSHTFVVLTPVIVFCANQASVWSRFLINTQLGEKFKVDS